MASGNQGGSRQQHIKAGEQSHKNTSGPSGSGSGSGNGDGRGQVKDPKHDGRLKENK